MMKKRLCDNGQKLDHWIVKMLRVTPSQIAFLNPIGWSKAMTPIEIMARAAYEQGEAEGSTKFGAEWDDPVLVNVRATFISRMKAALTALSDSGWSLVPSEADHSITAAVAPAGEDRRQAAQDYKAMIKAGAYKP
jgi:hypothetical protein